MVAIVSQGLTPPQSLGLQLQVNVGRNQVQRQVGNYSALYFADGANIQDSYIELQELKIWQSNPQETFQRIVISCSGNLIFEGIQPDNTTVKLPVNRMMVLDTEFRTFKLTNINTETVRANLHYVTTAQ